MIKSFFTYTPEEEAQRQALLDSWKASLDAFDAVRKSADSPERTAALNAARSESAQISQEQARLHFTAQKRYIADMSANPDLALEHVSEIVQAYTKEDIIKQIGQVKRLNDPYEAQLKDLLSDDNIVLSEEFQKSYKKELARIRRINATICRKNYDSAVYWLKFTCFEELDALKEHPDHAARADAIIAEKAKSLYKPKLRKTQTAQPLRGRPPAPADEQALQSYNARIDQLIIPGFFDEPYKKIFQGTPQLMIMRASPRNMKHDEISGKATLHIKGKGSLVVKDLNGISAAFTPSARKLFDTCAAILADRITYKISPDQPIDPVVMLDLDEWGLSCGFDLLPRHCETVEEMKADKKRIDSVRHDLHAMVRKDCKTFKATELSFKESTSPNSFYKMGIASGYGIKGNTARIAFDIDLARYMANAYLMQWPTALLKHDNRAPNDYSIGRKLAYQYSLDANRERGTNTRVSVKSLLEAAPQIIRYEDMIASGQRGWKKRIAVPLEASLDAQIAVGYLTRWAYYRKDEELTREQAKALSYEEYTALLVEFTPAEDIPDQTSRLIAKAERIEKKKRGRPKKNKPE